jgi:branched-chain amino acid transport system substrate-binding protein
VASAASASNALTPASIDTLHAYVGGSLGKANPKLSPITIGFVNDVGGESSFPWYNTEVQHAVAVVNDELGGIGGHPLRVSICIVVSAEEQGQACAEQFLANHSIKVVMTQGLDIGDTSLHATLDGKIPVIGGQPSSLTDATAKDSFYLTSGVFGATGMVTYLKDYLHAKTVAMLNANDVPVAVAAAGIIKGYLKAEGIHLTQGTFSASSTDYLPAIEAANAQGADAVLALVILPNQCLAMARSLKEAGVTKPPVISFFTCIDTSVKQGLGDYPKWTYFDFSPNVLGPAPNALLKAQFAAAENWEAPFLSQVPDAASGPINLSTILTIAKIFNELGPSNLTAGAIAAKIHAFTGPVFAGPQKIKFGGDAIFNDVGSLASYFPIYDGNGKWGDGTHGVPLVPPGVAQGIFN